MMVIENITSKSFRSFGRVIEYPNKHKKGNRRNLWRIVLTDSNAQGWRIAYLVLRNKILNRLESHPNTFESFEPVSGKSLFFVSSRKSPQKIRLFALNKPVILKKGVWHGLVSLTAESEIKITENAKVICRYYPLTKLMKTKISNQILSSKRPKRSIKNLGRIHVS